MRSLKVSRRRFMTAASAGSLAAAAKTARARPVVASAGRLAILGGEPVRKNKRWPDWPHVDEAMVAAVAKTARSGIWCRIQTTSGAVAAFEAKFAELLGAKFCVATGSGTQSLHTCVEAMGIGPGDEVITSPYTDPGTIASILAARALPVLADLDRESFQLDPADVEKKINGATKALMPVHMMGQPCDMQSMMSIAGRHGLRVIEDACQAHLAQHGGKRLGTIGDVGCFSFQSSKTLACGEGGAIVGNDEALMDACYTVHNHGTSRRGRTEVAGPKYRMNEFEAAILLAQMPGLMERFERRNRNAAHLTARLRDCPGIVPQKLYAGTESGSFYLYAMTYRKEHFEGASRGTFLKALAAEGVDLSPYIAQGLHREPWIDHIVNSKIYRKMYSPERLARYRDECACPRCDAVCQDLVMLWASGPLLGSTADMDDVADAILKVYEHRSELASI
ncbi:MAG TPA: DegT/DnrJ/EryC1/StrS family aminotransferase [Planctomycetota bacterium]|nr:DegT/DnrJ/EryC1/StrS family aminotransferase [Planctomycetota bacterium]OQC21441.1 MAG: L-glutamine:scyllo-inosose aminotransferase [Planctomycetes bacterium ADurb.Bin069]NMD36803.1 DegT/DnrJ/EryC1/StrS family aminotransferase [Planctomycetota bacterium]HNR97800.1 DegT/DnrJ/EryC1/StrS family aminotransferase [Planctomycetota bacterium]HNU24733.1 DegT/DnrJ/EryC1/StrS family aminotransferase [Planctomycetota bacterium]